MFLSVLHTSFNTPALNCPLSALGYSNFLHFIPILSVKWALCVEYSMSFGVCHYHRHWKGTCNLQKYNPFVPATSYWHFIISSEFHFHFKMIRSSIENEWIWISLHIDYKIRSLSWFNVFSYWFNKNYQFIYLGTYNRGHRDLLDGRLRGQYVTIWKTFWKILLIRISQ